MTVSEAITRIDQLKPNQFSTEQKTEWLSRLDGMIMQELIRTHEQAEEPAPFTGYDAEEDTGTELLVPFPYDDIYLFWLASQVDLYNLEYDKYANDSQLYNNAYQTYSDYYTRTNMPKAAVREFEL